MHTSSQQFALLVIAAILVLTFIPPNADASVTKGDVARVKRGL